MRSEAGGPLVDEMGVNDDTAVDPSAAVIAHGLLNSMAVITGAAATLRESWDRIGDKGRADLLQMIEAQSDHVTGMLTDLARGLSAEVVQLLESLRSERTVS